jgi:AraC-like DNA-binding protein
MALQLYTVIDKLRPYIKAICSMESQPGERNPALRVLPDTCVELFINYRDAPLTANVAGSLVTSRMSSFMDVEMLPGSGCIAVCFYPAAAWHFFSMPMNAITNGIIGLEHVWGTMAGEVEERIASARDNKERVTIIQQYLLRLFYTGYSNDKAVEHCLWQLNLFKGQLSAADLADKAGLSQRQLARRFNDRLGLAPKEYTRVSRFMHSLEVLKNNPAQSLTEIAYESGYYDQAHCIHEYREFAGLTPGELRAASHVLY